MCFLGTTSTTPPQKMLTLTDTPQGSQDCGRMGEVLMNGTKGGGRLGRHPATLGGAT